MAAAEREPAEDGGFVSYAQWGMDFFADAISEERLLGAVNDLAGRPIDFGPIGVGPGKLAKVRAHGEIGAAVAEPRFGEEIAYRVELPVRLTFELNLQVETHVFHAELRVPLTLTAKAAQDLRIYIDVTPPTPEEVEVVVRAEGFRASIMQRVAGVESELRRFVSRYITREITKPEVARARTIDVSGAIDRAWDSIAPKRAAETAAEDFNEALESEIRENPDNYLDL